MEGGEVTSPQRVVSLETEQCGAPRQNTDERCGHWSVIPAKCGSFANLGGHLSRTKKKRKSLLSVPFPRCLFPKAAVSSSSSGSGVCSSGGGILTAFTSSCSK
ncbi:hypothetical protein V5799_022985 [Amblyomma americanum]|uniref:Uncharacterized protein n=1 Tax=Amblyomma americanum TaxID=6943 RepID=A0AAQ4FJ80_AMBAM